MIYFLNRSHLDLKFESNFKKFSSNTIILLQVYVPRVKSMEIQTDINIEWRVLNSMHTFFFFQICPTVGIVARNLIDCCCYSCLARVDFGEKLYEVDVKMNCQMCIWKYLCFPLSIVKIETKLILKLNNFIFKNQLVNYAIFMSIINKIPVNMKNMNLWKYEIFYSYMLSL